MKQILFVFLFQATLHSAQSKNITLLDNWQDTSLITNSSEVRYSGLFTFSKSAEEYAVIGTTEGAYFLQLLENNEVLFTLSGKPAIVTSRGASLLIDSRSISIPPKV